MPRKASKNIQVPKVLTYHNKISPNYRALHVDGAYGGVTPKGFINLSFYSERFPIPKSTDFKIDEKTKSISKIKDSDDSKDGILKEYEFGIYMDLETTKKIVKFLNDKIVELTEFKKQTHNGNNSTKDK
ncbi:MAG: hypothetical protein H6550_09510 [Chitinophagales bacterium]|nr:hypothetical protein [Chitinophagales bacterium]